MGYFRKSCAMVTLAFGVALSGTAPLTAETLKDALRNAYRHSGLLEQQRALLRAADEDVAQALAALRPIISAQANASYANTVLTDDYNYSGSVALSASLTLLDGGQSKLAIDSAKESVLATRESLVSVEQQVLLRAVNAFLEVRRQSEFVALRQNGVRLITEELRAARDRFEVGEVTRTDVALAEARLAASRSSLAAAQGGLAQAREEYRAAVGRSPGRLSTLPTQPRIPSSQSAAASQAEQRHPDVLAAKRNVKIADLNTMRAQAAMRGTLSLNGSVSINDDFDGTESIGLQYSQPLYQGGRLSSLARQAQQRAAASRAGLHLTLHNIRQGVGNAYASLAVARATKMATNEQVRAADTAFQGVREEATLGSRTTLDVLDAEQELLDARTQRVSAVIDEQAAVYQALASMGLMTADYLNLGIATYDPAAYYNLVKTGPTKRSAQGQQLDRVLKALGKE
ncbi:MAG: TolC family outer membrane protein [Pseudomonadota bacterium]